MAQGGKSDWWRAVLGEYPTGVVLITSLDPAGEPVGMVVGSFTAVSQDPPLVGFFPDATSTTFPTVAANGRFAASVLGSEHEALCRAFVRRDRDRFARGAFVRSASGIPRLADAVAWFDVTIERRDRYGDHEFVVGGVDAFGVGTADAGLPLLFRRGGYGAFAVPSQEFDSETLAHRLEAADGASVLLAELADELDREVVVSTAVRDSVVVLSAVRPSTWDGSRGRRRIGAAFPLAAPIAPLFVAWSTPAKQAAWIEGSRHLVGAVDRAGLAELLAAVRRRGFGVSASPVLAERFEHLVHSPGKRRESFARLWSDIAADRALTDRDPERIPADAGAVQAPVFGPSGEVELVLTVTVEAGAPGARPVDRLAEAVLATADRLTERLGGTLPRRLAA